MAIQSVWGFDPDEVVGVSVSCTASPDDEPENSADEQRIARIPHGDDPQTYELPRVFRL